MLKKMILKSVERIESLFLRIKRKFIETKDLPLIDLAPNGDSKMIDNYIKYVKQALRNSKVYNIALSGIYGSGKSSIIEALKSDSLGDKEFNYLNISLANFNSENVTGEKLEEILEKSIVKQILYSGDRKKRPQSSFKGIVNVNEKMYLLKSTILVSVGVLYLLIYKNELITKKIEELYYFCEKITQSIFLNDMTFIIFLILIIGGLILFLNSLFRWIYINFKVSKINVFNSEMNSIEDTKGSSFNRHIDEIMYFFEVSNYNVVIFEDLDRFNNIEIFTKLRELNQLLRNSSCINQDIKFIYAIKDDLFLEINKAEEIDEKNSCKNRTKFFEMIIPVIPIVNHSNSVELIKDRLKAIDQELIEQISLKFIKKLSFYIDDMRLLNNIVNEFYIYSKGLNTLVENILFDYKKLLAMITYKNLYPNDFAKLQVKEGFLYKVFNNINILKEGLIKEIEKEIEEIDTILRNIDKSLLDSKDELVKVYCANIVSRLNGKYQIKYKNKYINFLELKSKDFEDIISGEIKRYEFQDSYGYTDNVNVSNIKNAYNTLENYDDRIKREYNKVGFRKQEWIDKKKTLKNRKKEIQGMRLNKLLSHSDSFQELEIYKELEKNSLLNFLLKEGNIDESYNDYLTYFYTGSLLEEEKLFIRSIYSNDKTGLEIKLKNIENILEELYQEDFNKDSILNNSLIFNIINNKSKYYNEVICKLADNGEASKKFIIDNTEYLSKNSIFISDLAKKWDSLWQFIFTSELVEPEHKKEVFINILRNVENKLIERLNKENSIVLYLQEMKEFLNLDFEGYQDKIEELLVDLNIKFITLNFNNSKLQEFVLRNKLYQINTQIISGILQSFNVEEISYTNILGLNKSFLTEYIDDNIEIFIKDIYTHLPGEVDEQSENIVRILNNENIEEDILERVIEIAIFNIDEINDIKRKSLWNKIIETNKLYLNWDNILYYYEEYGLDIVLIKLFNIEENVLTITTEELQSVERSKKMKLDEDIIYSKEIEDKYVIKLINSFGYSYSNSNMELINSIRIKELINGNLIELNNDNLQGIMEFHNDELIDYVFNNFDEFIKNIDEYKIGGQNIINLLKDERVDSNNKKTLIEKISIEQLIEVGICEEILFIINENSIYLSETLILDIISNSKNINLNLKVLDNFWEKVQEQDEYLVKEAISNSFILENIDDNTLNLNNEGLVQVILQVIIELRIINDIKFSIIEILFRKTIDDNIRVRVIIELLSVDRIDNINKLISLINYPYNDIAKYSKQPRLEYTDQNLELVELLDNKGIISSYTVLDDGQDTIRVNTFRSSESARKREVVKQ